jgi:hypothetical protein
MQPRESAAHRVQSIFPQHLFDARKQYVLLEAHMIVKKFSDARDFFRFDRRFCRKPLLEIRNGSANLGVIGEHAHHFRVAVESRVSRIRREQDVLLLAKMHVPRLVPEADEFLCLALYSRASLFVGSFRRAPHLQRLNQREVVVLAKWMQTRMALHVVTRFGEKPANLPVGAADGLAEGGAVQVFAQVH